MNPGFSSSLPATRGKTWQLRFLSGFMGMLLLWLLVVLHIIPLQGLPAVLLMIAAVSFLLVKGRESRDLLHPVRVFGALWCFCLALASMRLLPLISDWDFSMWNCMLTALVAFVFGVWIATLVCQRRAVMRRQHACGLGVGTFLPNRKTLAVATVCLGIGMAALAYEYSLIGEVPILSDNPDAARMKLFGVAGQADPEFNTISIKLLHPLVGFNKYAVFLACIFLFQKRSKSKGAMLLSILIVIVGILAYSSQGGRTFVVEIAIVGTALFHYLRRRVRLPELIAAVAVLSLFVALYGSYRIKKSESAPLFERALSASALPEGELSDGITFGYATVTLSYEMFYRLMEDFRNVQKPPSGFVLYAFHSFIPRTNIQEFAFDLYSGESITSTFLGEFYADYGYWGTLLGPLLLGLCYGWVYSRGDQQCTVYWVYVRALFLQMLIFFPYVNLFSQYLTWIFDLSFMYLLIRCVAPQQKRFPEVLYKRQHLAQLPT